MSKTQILHFLLLDIHMCVDLNYIKRVILIAMTECVPNAPNYILGVLNISGKSIPIVDLAMRLGLKRKQAYTLDAPILLCTDGQYTAGFIVDNILGLNEIESENIQQKNDFRLSTSILGVVPIGSSLALILNIADLLVVNKIVEEPFLLQNKLMDITNSDEQPNHREE